MVVAYSNTAGEVSFVRDKDKVMSVSGIPKGPKKDRTYKHRVKTVVLCPYTPACEVSMYAGIVRIK